MKPAGMLTIVFLVGFDTFNNLIQLIPSFLATSSKISIR